MGNLLVRFRRITSYAQESSVATVLCFLAIDHIIDLWLQHSSEGSIENRLRKVCNIVRYSFTQQESREVV